MTRRLVAMAAACAAVAASLTMATASDAVFGREFRASARAYPIEPDPGQNQTSFAVRPVAVEGGLASTPLGANGRAAVLDTGIIENQTVEGERVVPEESFARCDTVSPNVPDEEERTVGAISLAALCTAGPAFEARAVGITPAAAAPAPALEALGISGGEISSRAFADASGDRVAADSVSALSDVTIGPLHIETLRFRSHVEATGRAGGARADWAVEALAADVGGVPVVIGAGGVQVDEQAVPDPLVGEATRAVQEAFARSGGFIDVRIAEPSRTAAADGSSAEVKGGGLYVFTTSGTEANDREFLGLTLLGGSARVDVGEPRAATNAFSPSASGAPRVGGLTAEGDDRLALRRAQGSPPAVDAGEIAPAAAAAPPAVALTRATTRRALPGPSSWWIVALVLGVAAAALAASSSFYGPLVPARRYVVGWCDHAAERFLRG